MTRASRQSVWPVLLLVLPAVVAPTACVLWLMNQAVRNEQLAVQQRLREVYQGRLAEARRALDQFWADKQAALAMHAVLPAPQRFARMIESGVADSVVLLTPQGEPDYPRPSNDSAAEPTDSAWRAAVEVEHEQAQPALAAAAYARIAEGSTDPARTAMARLAEARCLVAARQPLAAIVALDRIAREPRLRTAHDESGRRISDTALLMQLQLSQSLRLSPASQPSVQPFIDRVRDYTATDLPSAQRCFLMRSLQELVTPRPEFPKLAAEELALTHLDKLPQDPPAGQITTDLKSHVSILPSKDGRVLALFADARLQATLAQLLEDAVGLADVDVKLVSTGAAPSHGGTAFVATAAGNALPDHQIAIFLRGPDPFAAAAHRRIALYTWIAWAGVLLVTLFGALLARFVTRQIRLTRLKNDFVATVSHELKTPLASMRVLIDTLSQGRCRDESQAREYYALIAHENERLTRLIDNFLTFSRMERDRRAFEFQNIRIADVMEAAVSAMGDRLRPPRGQLTIEIPDDLPMVLGDRDALITVFLNLLDNACKYSPQGPRIQVQAATNGDDVCVSVCDEGIGLSRRAARRVFDRFYQVDRSLSREVGGCGLGLSIVQFIVTAHGGTVSVSSEPGRGSTFQVILPVANAHATGVVTHA